MPPTLRTPARGLKSYPFLGYVFPGVAAKHADGAIMRIEANR
jgi:hypothetical protein